MPKQKALLSPTEAKRLQGVQNVIRWRKDPVLWASERLGIDEKTLDWAKNNPHKYAVSGWDGTPNPIKTIGKLLGDGHWVGVESGTGTGKAQPIDHPVLTPSGWKRIGDLTVKDYVIGSNGSPTRVDGVFYRGVRRILEITFSDGSTTACCDEHLWNIQNRKMKARGEWRTVEAKELSEYVGWHIPQMSSPAALSKRNLPVDPYVFGLLLGDGTLRAPGIRISSVDPEVIASINALTDGDISLTHNKGPDWTIKDGSGHANRIKQAFVSYGMDGCYAHEKFVPDDYMLSDQADRLAVLQGLLDTDGTVSRSGTAVFDSTSRRLAEDVANLARSLGGFASISKRARHYTDPGTKKKRQGRDAYTVRIDVPMCPFRITRKAKLWKPRSTQRLRRIVSVVEVDPQEAVCISVEAGDSLYVTNDYIVTHNTFFAAVLVLWFLDCWPKARPTANSKGRRGSLVITTATKETQLRDGLWKEIGGLWEKFQKIRPEAQLMSLRILMNPKDHDKNAWGAVGLTVGVGSGEELATKFQGYHNEDMLIIFEETPGINRATIGAGIETCGAPHNLILALGNPDNEFDPLHEFCLLESVKHITISSLDHPNVKLQNPDIVPGAVSWESIQRRLKNLKGDTDHPKYLSRVRGICPVMNDSALWRPEAIKAVAEKLKRPRIEIYDFKEDVEIHYFQEPQTTHLNRYILFADVAGDGEKGDHHACVVLDRVEKSVVATIYARCSRVTYAKALVHLAMKYSFDYGRREDPDRDIPADPRWNNCLLAWETQGVGALHLIPEFKAYPNLYYRRSVEKDSSQPRSTMGWVTTSKTRDMMISELGEWGLDLITNPTRLNDERILKEARTFVWEVKNKKSGDGRYEAKSGFHDDLMMALGGALVLDKMLPSYIKLKTPEDSISDKKEFLIDRWRRERLRKSAVPAGGFFTNGIDIKKMRRRF